MTNINKIVLHIPHASVNGIFGPYGKWPCNPHFINDCVIKWTDWYTDFLFATSNEDVTSVVFPYSRFVCDAERLETTRWKTKDRVSFTGSSAAIRGEC